MRLLDVQAFDSRADQLRHQRATLPELAEIGEVRRALAALRDRTRDAQIVVDDLASDQRKAEADVASVRARRERDRDRMDRGLVSSPKDLERMRMELVSLERRITVLEDAELEIMERSEEAQATLESSAAQVTVAEARLSHLTALVGERTQEIDAQLAEIASEREPVAVALPGDLLALYDRLRPAKGGVGAAALKAGECGGCRLSLDNAELASIKAAPSDEVIRCEECQRILVRTFESGK